MKHGIFKQQASIGGLYRVHNSILLYLGAVAYNENYSKVHTRWCVRTVQQDERSINRTLFSNRCAAEFNYRETTVFTCIRTSASQMLSKRAPRHTFLVSIIRRCHSVRWAYLARFLAIPADLSDSVGLVPVFKFQEPRGSGVDEALVEW